MNEIMRKYIFISTFNISFHDIEPILKRHFLDIEPIENYMSFYFLPKYWNYKRIRHLKILFGILQIKAFQFKIDKLHCNIKPNVSIIFTQSNWNKFLFFTFLLLFRWNYFQWAINGVLNIHFFFALLTIVILIKLRLWHAFAMGAYVKRHNCLIGLFRYSNMLSCVSFYNLQFNWVIRFLSFCHRYWMQFVQQQQQQKCQNVHMMKTF